jgi:hypothetical protein
MRDTISNLVKSNGIDVSRQRFIARVSFHVIAPILIGAVIYILWRSKNLFVFRWLEMAGLAQIVTAAREYGFFYRSSIPQIVLYSLPDALWVYSYTAALALIWERDLSRQRLIWILLPTVTAVGAEFVQFFHIISGTFDWSDVWSYLVAGFFGSNIPIINVRLRRPAEHEDLYAIR